MYNTKARTSKRVMAVWLCLAILMSTLPISLSSVFARAQGEPVFTITVKDQDGDPIESANIYGTYGAIPISGSTDSDGVLTVPAITEDIEANQTDKELILSVTAIGYQNITNQSYGFFGDTADDEFANVDVIMTGNAAIITTDPQSDDLRVDETLSLSVVASNVKSYQWYKDGSPIDGATNAVFTKAAALSDEGTYKCVVTGTDGVNVDSDDAEITVSKITTDVGISAAPTNNQARPNAVVLSATGLPVDATGTLTFFEDDEEIGVVTIGTGTQTVSFNAPSSEANNNFTFKVAYSSNATKYYDSESSELTFNFVRGTQSIDSISIDAQSTIFIFGDEPFEASAIGGVGTGTITWGIVDENDFASDVAEVDSNGVVTILKAGSFWITASRGENNDYIAMASPAKSCKITVNEKSQSIAFTTPTPSESQTFYEGFTFPNTAAPLPEGGEEDVNWGSGIITYAIMYGGTGTAEISLNSGLISNVTVAGTLIIRATKAECIRFSETFVEYTLTIGKANQTGFAFDESAPDPMTYTDAIGFGITASGGQSTDNAITYAITGVNGEATINETSGIITNITSAGTYKITANKPSDSLYNEAFAEYDLEVIRKDQTGFDFNELKVHDGTSFVNVPNISCFLSNDFRYGMSVKRLASGGQTGGMITYKVTAGTTIATISANGVVTVLKLPPVADTGTVFVDIKATLAGNLVYNPASVTYRIYIHRDNVTAADFRVNGAAIKSTTEWYNAADVATHGNIITVTPFNDYTQISTDGLTWHSKPQFTTEAVINTSFYLRKVNGATTNISSAQTINFDKTAPENATIKIGTFNKWTNFWNTITFGLFSKDTRQIAITATDALSGVASIQYHEDNTGTDFTLAQAAGLTYTTYNDSSKPSVSFSGLQNKRVVIYAKVTDVAGNTSYFRTNGMVFDNMNPTGETTLPASIIEITLPPSKTVGLYNNNVPFRVQVTDPNTSGLASGLASVTTTISAPHRDDKVITATAAVSGLNPADMTFDSNNITAAFNNSGTYVVEREYDSNHVTIKVEAVDKAGNTYTRTVSLAVDITAPQINVSYDHNTFSNGTYLGNNLNRKATIDITELNFDNSAVVIDVTRDGEKVNITPAFTAISGAEAKDANGDQIGWRMIIDYAQFGDGDYTFDISYTDKATNANATVNYGDSVNPRAFTIDNTKPIIEITYAESDADDPSNGSYFKGTRTATIKVTERNWLAIDFVLTLVSEDNASGTYQRFDNPPLSGWTSNGYERTATINFVADGRYTLTASYTDLASNVAAYSREDIFFIDRTDPVIPRNLGDINIDSYVNGAGSDVAPRFTVTDSNFNQDGVQVSLTTASGRSVPLNGSWSYSDDGRSGTYTFPNFEDVKDSDDIYTLTVTVTDRAGRRSTSEGIEFSVNRYGSTFKLDNVMAINGKYHQSIDDLVITELNPNTVDFYSISLSKNGNISPLNTDGATERSGDYKRVAAEAQGDWSEYTYTVYDKNFNAQGNAQIEVNYVLTIQNKDIADNENRSDDEDKGGIETTFAIDTMSPRITSLDIESGKTYPEDGMTAHIQVSDMLLGTVRIELDGQEAKDVTVEGDIHSFHIPAGNRSRTLNVITVDSVGNEATEDIEGFHVSANWFYLNRVLLISSTIAVVLLAAGLSTFLIIRKRKKITA